MDKGLLQVPEAGDVLAKNAVRNALHKGAKRLQPLLLQYWDQDEAFNLLAGVKTKLTPMAIGGANYRDGACDGCLRVVLASGHVYPEYPHGFD